MSEFDPATLNPSAWYRADLGLYQDLGVTPAASDGDPVMQWNDLSGNGNHLTNAGGTVRPLLKLDQFNGRPAIRFDGIDDQFVGPALSSFITASEYDFYAVLKVTQIAGDAPDSYDLTALWEDDGGHAGTMFKQQPSIHAYNWDGSDDATARMLSLSTHHVIRQWHAGGILYSRVDGQVEQAVASGDTTSLTYIMGICKNWKWSVPVKYLGADVAELLWRKTLLTIQEQIDYETYLFTRYFKGVPIMSSGRFPLHKL